MEIREIQFCPVGSVVRVHCGCRIRVKGPVYAPDGKAGGHYVPVEVIRLCDDEYGCLSNDRGFFKDVVATIGRCIGAYMTVGYDPILDVLDDD